ncbi:small ARF-like GTPase [Chloropicon primus]|uniref:Small ARF-like GTPase n=1 Tax=Chloropicon primus TaxID=1764295 RepID=A0A5B8MYI5_9CHLO|nr:small ARF-like GTPase [Chloropicon primus]UPR03828.1 small ARF-like GTPase [Chloropicon primus]|eukprot:QDZ24620.1 small ARF-like GTPase [Chloropicon primus]
MLRKKKSSRDGKTDLEILFLGLEGSGKTLLVRRLKEILSAKSGGKRAAAAAEAAGFSTNVVPTIGVNVDTVKVKGQRCFTLREVGGAMKPLWKTYLDACTGVVFCIDLSDDSSFATASVELMTLASSKALEGKPLLAIFTKTDAPFTMSRAQVGNMVSSWKATNIQSFALSAYTGDGCRDLASAVRSL